MESRLSTVSPQKTFLWDRGLLFIYGSFGDILRTNVFGTLSMCQMSS